MSTDFPLIPRFQDLELIGGSCTLGELAEAAEASLRGWSRNAEVEERMREFASTDTPFAVFLRHAERDSGLPAVNLFIREVDDGFEVTNIVPTESGSLDADEYNELLADFCSSGLDGLAEELDFNIVASQPVYDLREELGEEAGRLLLMFSRAANRSTGASHPSDSARWMDFLVEAHRASDPKSYVTLVGEWLEADGWHEEAASALAIQYEFSMGLLDRARRS